MLQFCTKKGWFNPLWLLQLQIVFTKLNRIHNWADTLYKVSHCHSVTAQLGKRELKKLSKITDLEIKMKMVYYWHTGEITSFVPLGFCCEIKTQEHSNTKYLILTKETYQFEVETIYKEVCQPVYLLQHGNLKMAGKFVQKLGVEMKDWWICAFDWILEMVVNSFGHK